MKESCHYRIAAGALLLALAFTVTGCRTDGNGAAPGSSSAQTPPAAEHAGPVVSPSAAAASADAQNQEKLAAAANNVQQAGASEGSGSKNAVPVAAKPKKTFEAYSVDKPQIMGVSIGESKDKTFQLHGAPFETYVMEDGEDPITVYEYEGFNVGFNNKQQVEFVEIATDDVDPGLNGLRLGQTTADALIAMGKPDSNTEYVWSYKTKKTVLKLDVDPKTKSVLSIKLFGRED